MKKAEVEGTFGYKLILHKEPSYFSEQHDKIDYIDILIKHTDHMLVIYGQLPVVPQEKSLHGGQISFCKLIGCMCRAFGHTELFFTL